MLDATERLRLSSELRFPSDLVELRGLPFLRRNINRYLEHEEQRLRDRGRGPAPHSSLSTSRSDSLSFGSWQYPIEQMVASPRNDGAPVLRVDVRSIRPRAPQNAISHQGRTDKRAKLSDVSCHVELRVNKADGAVVCKTSNRARIVGRTDDHGQLRFDVKMSEAIRMPLAELTAALAEKDSPRRVFALSYRTHISITFVSKEDAVPFLRKMSPNSSSAVDTRGQTTSLRATWKGLPNCPAKGEYLRLIHVVNENEIKTKYELEVDMSWNKKFEGVLSPLQDVQMRSRTNKDTQLPTPVSESPAPHEMVTVQYGIRDPSGITRIQQISGYSCCYCKARNEPLEFTNYDRLLHHHSTTHETVRFDYKIKENKSDTETHVLVHVNVIELKPRESRESREFRESREARESRESSVDSVLSCINVDVDWRRPQEPFQANKHLNGKHKWEPKVTKRKTKQENTVPQRARTHVKRPDPEIPICLAKRNSLIRKPPKKKYKMPRNKKNLSMFKSKARMIALPDELVEESDLEIDVEWAEQAVEWRLLMNEHEGIPLEARKLAMGVNEYVKEYQDDNNPLTDYHLVKFAVYHAKGKGLVSDPFVLADWLGISRKAVLIPDHRININDILVWWRKAPSSANRDGGASTQDKLNQDMSPNSRRRSEYSVSNTFTLPSHISPSITAKLSKEQHAMLSYFPINSNEQHKTSQSKKTATFSGEVGAALLGELRNGSKRLSRISIPDSEMEDVMDDTGNRDVFMKDVSGDYNNGHQHSKQARHGSGTNLDSACTFSKPEPKQNQRVQLGRCICGQLVGTFARTIVCSNDVSFVRVTTKVSLTHDCISRSAEDPHIIYAVSSWTGASQAGYAQTANSRRIPAWKAIVVTRCSPPQKKTETAFNQSFLRARRRKSISWRKKVILD